MSSLKKKNSELKKHGLRRSLGSIAKIFMVYFIIFVVVFAWIDYYTFEFFNPVPFVLFSLLVAAIATFVHMNVGKKSEVDDLAKKL